MGMGAKQKAEHEAKIANGHQQRAQGGMINKLRNFFGGSGGGNGKRESKVVGGNRKKMIEQRNASSSTVEKAAPTLDDAKKKAKEIVKKGKDLKDKAVKEITGNTSEEEAAIMADMEFKSVGNLGDGKKNKKPKKPPQML